MARISSYAEIEKALPLIVKVELDKQDDIFRKLFAEEFSKKRVSVLTAYLCALVTAHRWYLGSPSSMLLQWVLAILLIGIPWIVVDWFRMPGMCRRRNEEIAKTVLAEQKILSLSSNMSR